MGRIIDAVVVDGDNTLWKGRVSAAIGMEYLAKAKREHDLVTFVNGLVGTAQVEMMVRFFGIKGESAGQKRFYDTLVANGIGKMDEIHNFAAQHMRNNRIEKVEDIVTYYTMEGVPVFLSTMAGTTAAGCAKESFKFTEAASNKESFDDEGRLRGFTVMMCNGEEKLAKTEEMLDRYGLMVSECMVIGDSINDIPLLRSAKIARASPFASEEVLALKRIVRMTA